MKPLRVALVCHMLAHTFAHQESYAKDTKTLTEPFLKHIQAYETQETQNAAGGRYSGSQEVKELIDRLGNMVFQKTNTMLSKASVEDNIRLARSLRIILQFMHNSLHSEQDALTRSSEPGVRAFETDVNQTIRVLSSYIKDMAAAVKNAGPGDIYIDTESRSGGAHSYADSSQDQRQENENTYRRVLAFSLPQLMASTEGRNALSAQSTFEYTTDARGEKRPAQSFEEAIQNLKRAAVEWQKQKGASYYTSTYDMPTANMGTNNSVKKSPAASVNVRPPAAPKNVQGPVQKLAQQQVQSEKTELSDVGNRFNASAGQSGPVKASVNQVEPVLQQTEKKRTPASGSGRDKGDTERKIVQSIDLVTSPVVDGASRINLNNQENGHNQQKEKEVQIPQSERAGSGEQMQKSPILSTGEKQQKEPSVQKQEENNAEGQKLGLWGKLKNTLGIVERTKEGTQPMGSDPLQKRTAVSPAQEVQNSPAQEVQNEKSAVVQNVEGLQEDRGQEYPEFRTVRKNFLNAFNASVMSKSSSFTNLDRIEDKEFDVTSNQSKSFAYFADDDKENMGPSKKITEKQRTAPPVEDNEKAIQNILGINDKLLNQGKVTLPSSSDLGGDDLESAGKDAEKEKSVVTLSGIVAESDAALNDQQLLEAIQNKLTNGKAVEFTLDPKFYASDFTKMLKNNQNPSINQIVNTLGKGRDKAHTSVWTSINFYKKPPEFVEYRYGDDLTVQFVQENNGKNNKARVSVRQAVQAKEPGEEFLRKTAKKQSNIIKIDN
jgi:hypothetical protein